MSSPNDAGNLSFPINTNRTASLDTLWQDKIFQREEIIMSVILVGIGNTMTEGLPEKHYLYASIFRKFLFCIPNPSKANKG